MYEKSALYFSYHEVLCVQSCYKRGKKGKLYTNKKLKLEKTPISSCKSKLEQEKKPTAVI